MAAAVIAVRNARARRENQNGLFSSSAKAKPKRPSSARPARREDEAGSTLWESIFGKKPDPNRRSVQYSADGIKRAEKSSIAKVVDVIGCSEEQARARLQVNGWSVHDTVASMINECRPQSAGASLSSSSSPAARGRVIGRGQAAWADEPSEEDKMVAVALFLSVVSTSNKEEATRYLCQNGWNVQDALRFALNSNPGLPLFDGQGFQVPVGVPIAMAEAGVAGHHVVGGDVWETQSNMTELLDGDNSNIPVGIAIEP